MSFDGAHEKVYIASLDSPSLKVTAQFNPKELEIVKSVPWQKHPKPNANGLQLEFTGAEPRSMTLELLFDGYEDNTSVSGEIATLEQMSSVQDMGGDSALRRPHHCVVVWGTVIEGTGGGNRFTCVIEQMTTKYTMFHSNGYPLRATVNLKLKEADRVTMKKKKQ